MPDKKNHLNYFSHKERDGIMEFARQRTMLVASIAPWLKRIGFNSDLLSFMGLSLLIPVVLLFNIYPVASGILIWVYVLFDAIDGAYARCTRSSSQGGALTDIVCDHLGLFAVGLCSIYHGLLNPTLGAYYIAVYMVMIGLTVVQNAMSLHVRMLLRSKYFFYGLYCVWALLGHNLMNYVVPVFAVAHTATCLVSFVAIKRHLNILHPPEVELRSSNRARWLAVLVLVVAGAVSFIIWYQASASQPASQDVEYPDTRSSEDSGTPSTQTAGEVVPVSIRERLSQYQHPHTRNSPSSPPRWGMAVSDDA